MLSYGNVYLDKEPLPPLLYRRGNGGTGQARCKDSVWGRVEKRP